MLNVSLDCNDSGPMRVLCLGSHADDLEIGCGGSLLTLLRANPRVEVKWVVFSASVDRAAEARASAESFLGDAAAKEVHVEDFRDGYFPYVGADIKDYFERLKRGWSPHLIFTHYRDDRHQDHRLISDLTWNTFRNHLILEYEVPKYDGDLGAPNVFVPLDRATCERKATAITELFRSQQDRHWFTEDTFLSVLRLRGLEAASPSGYAEGFFSRKAVLNFAQCGD